MPQDSRPIADNEVLGQLDRIFASPGFSGSERLRRFLSFIVKLTLERRQAEIKEYLLAIEVFDRPESYDPHVDSIVRVEASRLRSKLREYYSGAGKDDPVSISIPRGSYVPQFEVTRTPEPASSPVPRKRWLLIAAAVACASIAVFAFLNRTPRPSDTPASAALLEAHQLLRTDFRVYRNDGRIPPDLEKAIAKFEEAISLEPSFAKAHAGLAMACEMAIDFEASGIGQMQGCAEGAARRAIELDSELAEAHAVLGTLALYRKWDWKQAETALRRAIELNPRELHVRREYSDLLGLTGRTEEAVLEITRALAIEPNSSRLLRQKAVLLYNANRFDESLQVAEKALGAQPDSSEAHYLIGLAHEGQGQLEEAEQKYRTVLSHAPRDARALPALGYVLARQGKLREAEGVRAEIHALARRGRSMEVPLALVYAGLADTEKALHWLEQAYANRDPSLPYVKVMPRFASLRTQQRLIELLRKLNLS